MQKCILIVPKVYLTWTDLLLTLITFQSISDCFINWNTGQSLTSCRFYSNCHILVADQITAADQSASPSFWSPSLKSTNLFAQDSATFFPTAHGLVQTHPSSAFRSGFGGIDNLGSRGVTMRPPRTRPLDYNERSTAELRRNPSLSSPDECARACRENEPPRICYYHFTLEYYTVLGA